MGEIVLHRESGFFSWEQNLIVFVSWWCFTKTKNFTWLYYDWLCSDIKMASVIWVIIVVSSKTGYLLLLCYLLPNSIFMGEHFRACYFPRPTMCCLFFLGRDVIIPSKHFMRNLQEKMYLLKKSCDNCGFKCCDKCGIILLFVLWKYYANQNQLYILKAS